MKMREEEYSKAFIPIRVSSKREHICVSGSWRFANVCYHWQLRRLAFRMSCIHPDARALDEKGSSRENV